MEVYYMALQPILRPWQLFFKFLDPIHRTKQTQKKRTQHPCLEWDSNPRPQSLRMRRQFIPYIALPLWSSNEHYIYEVVVSTTLTGHNKDTTLAAATSSVKMRKWEPSRTAEQSWTEHARGVDWLQKTKNCSNREKTSRAVKVPDIQLSAVGLTVNPQQEGQRWEQQTLRAE
jgi:hypothetical protein